MEMEFEKLITKQIEAITELGSSAFQNGYDAGFQAGCRFKEAEFKVEADKKIEGIDELVAKRKRLRVNSEGYGDKYNRGIEDLGDDIKEYFKK